MRKTLLLGVTSFILAFGPAMASSQSMKASKRSQSPMTGKHHVMAAEKVTGKVKSWNGSQLSLTTSTGKEETFVLAPKARRPDSLKEGNEVTVWYKEANGQKTASRISLAPDQSMGRGAKAMKHSARRHPSSQNSGS